LTHVPLHLQFKNQRLDAKKNPTWDVEWIKLGSGELRVNAMS